MSATSVIIQIFPITFKIYSFFKNSNIHEKSCTLPEILLCFKITFIPESFYSLESIISFSLTLTFEKVLALGMFQSTNLSD